MRLRIVHSDGKQAELSLESEVVRLGRDAACEVPFDPATYPTVSGRHAQIEREIFVATRVKGKPDTTVPVNALPETQKANEWFLMDILIRGDTMTVKVNGRQVNKFRDADNNFTSGHIVL